MYIVAPDQSVLDREGRVVFFSIERFISDIAKGDCCFICGKQRNSVPFNDEHVIPDWLLRRFNLHGRLVVIPNQTGFRYGQLTVPCCVTCNAEMGERFERPISELFARGYDAVAQEVKKSGPWPLFCWMALIFFKAHLKNKYLNFHLDRRKGDLKIAEIHSWEDLHHLHCIVRSFHSRAKIDQEVLGSLLVLPAKVRPHFEGFDFIDLTFAQTMLLSIGDTALIAVFNDAQSAITVALEDFQRKLSGPLSPIQLREVATILASINLQVEPRPRFFSQVDPLAEIYEIRAQRPDEFQITAWDDELHGMIMHKLTEDLLKPMRDNEKICDLVKSGLYTFLTTPEGTFDADSMELEEISAPLRADPNRRVPHT
jgi:hypothetical protein